MISLAKKTVHVNISYSVVMINAIELPPEEETQHSLEEYTNVNADLPYLLSDFCQEKGWIFIQLSNSLVFSGDKNCGYKSIDIPDATTKYGKSKAQGEVHPHTMTIRCDVVGEDDEKKLGLVERLKQAHFNGEKEIVVESRFWNGVTLPEFAQLVEIAILHEKYWKGIKHWGCKEAIDYPTLAKYYCTLLNIPLVITPGPIVKRHMLDGADSITTTLEVFPRIMQTYKNYQVRRTCGGDTLRFRFIVINMAKSIKRLEQIKSEFLQKQLIFQTFPAVPGSECKMVKYNDRFEHMYYKDDMCFTIDRAMEPQQKRHKIGYLAGVESPSGP